MVLGSMEYVAVGYLTIDEIISEGSVTRSLGGSVAYGAIAAKRYGVTPYIISKVGYDFPEDFLLLLSRYGIAVEGVKRVNAPSTFFRLVYEKDERKVVLKSRCQPITLKELEAVDRTEVMHVGYVFHDIDPTCLKYLREKCRIIAVDVQGLVRFTDSTGIVKLRQPSYPRLWEMLSKVDVIHGEFKEAEILTGIANPKTSAIRIFNRTGALSAVTLGIKGSIIACNEGVFKIPPLQVGKTVDPTGAGDIYTAILSLALSEGEDPIYAAAIASVASGKSVTEKAFKGIPIRREIFEHVEAVYNNIEKIG